MSEHTAAVWLLDCRDIGDAALESFASWLSPSEGERLDRFARPDRRRQFLAGRILLREALAALLDEPAPTFRLLERPSRAPALEHRDASNVGFSLSHSGPWVACAVSASTALGLDIERIDASRYTDELAAQALDPEQQAWLAARPEAGRARDFFQLWSVREARFKLHVPVNYATAWHHPALSVALCSARPLARKPQLQPVALTPPGGAGMSILVS